MQGPEAPEDFDCRACGACCMDAGDGRIPVGEHDVARWQRQGRLDVLAGLVEGHFGARAFGAGAKGRCRHLGAPSGDLDCAIYPTRGESCRRVEPGDRQCREYRRRFPVGPKARDGGAD